MDWLSINRERSVPYIRQVYVGIREAIHSGKLKPGEKLPSTRELAERLGVSRNVVMEAYDMLFAEGYVSGKKGKGTFVAEGAQLDRLPDMPKSRRKDASVVDESVIDFRTGMPDGGCFPRGLWVQCYKKAVLNGPTRQFHYQPAAGSAALREALAGYLRRARGIVCDPDCIVVTNGAAQALAISAKLLLGPGRAAAIENPSTREIRSIFASYGGHIHSVPVDRGGIVTSALPDDPRVRMIYVTPSHQFPTGGVLPIQRRIELLHYARSVDAYIVEDDYDSEFRYEGPPVSALYELDPDRVIYVGTLSKMLSPSLRIGYAVLPEPLVENFIMEKWISDIHTHSLEQEALAVFIDEGHLERHVRKMRHRYRKKQQLLVKSLAEKFNGNIELFGTSTGLHISVHAPHLPASPEPVNVGGVRLYPVQYHVFGDERRKHEWMFGFGHLSEQEIVEGVRRLPGV
ncbi:MocR-like pyridoxine biosynthesis transcription factor PdxR [Paenibacillus alkalitolerans]|uniref:MocR-like pyridoxine biosynthesis transcription factor PdxR n=1 Tax=Paenibacillus alkalitolerans TaxID=2799335 RepID=UPI0018F49B5F|nr:PLP-dependent aminotransferase family protein [Paenibacillus alkalitolerans]